MTYTTEQMVMVAEGVGYEAKAENGIVRARLKGHCYHDFQPLVSEHTMQMHFQMMKDDGVRHSLIKIDVVGESIYSVFYEAMLGTDLETSYEGKGATPELAILDAYVQFIGEDK